MKKVALVVEGPSDKAFFQSQRGWFEALGLQVAVTTGHNKNRLMRDAAKHVAVNRARGRELIALAVDLDQDDCPPSTAAAFPPLPGSGILRVVVCRNLEAWFLADHVAIRAASKAPYSAAGMTDDILDPVSKIRDVFYVGRKQYLSKTEIARLIAPVFSFSRARLKNRSINRFVSRVEGMAAL